MPEGQGIYRGKGGKKLTQGAEEQEEILKRGNIQELQLCILQVLQKCSKNQRKWPDPLSMYKIPASQHRSKVGLTILTSCVHGHPSPSVGLAGPVTKLSPYQPVPLRLFWTGGLSTDLFPCSRTRRVQVPGGLEDTVAKEQLSLRYGPVQSVCDSPEKAGASYGCCYVSSNPNLICHRR